jgi:predicted nucleic acid-binding protein
MPSVVVDTDVVSFEFKGDSRASLYDPHLAGKLLVITFMTLAELDLWMLEHSWKQKRRARMERFLRRFVLYPYDRLLCGWWAEATHRARRNGRPISQADAWIAATALGMDVPLVTNNPTDYAGVDGLKIISEVAT